MAKGSESKDAIYKKLFEVFPNAFMEDTKIMRIPMKENGETIEIKVTLTAAKNILGGESMTEVAKNEESIKVESNLTEPSEEEKQNVISLLERLGMKKEG